MEYRSLWNVFIGTGSLRDKAETNGNVWKTSILGRITTQADSGDVDNEDMKTNIHFFYPCNA